MFSASALSAPSFDSSNHIETRAATASAASDLTRLMTKAIGADGAIMILRQDGVDKILCEYDLIHASRRPPAAPFMLAAKRERSGSAEWREAGDGLWLVVRLPLSGSAELSYNARFDTPPPPEAEANLALFGPPLEAFASAFAAQGEAARRLESYQAALNQSELGIVLLAPDGAMLFANSIARAMLEAGTYLRRRGDGIGARDLKEALKLQVAIEHVRTRDGGAIEDPVIAIKRKYPLRPLLVCVSPIGIDDKVACDAGAVLRIIDPDRENQPSLEPICAHYLLSPVETRLACQLAGGATVEMAAAKMRIKPQTARSYLKQIFLKTDTNRQSDLVRLLLTSVVRAVPVGRFRIF